MSRIEEIKARIENILKNEGFKVSDFDINGNRIYTDESNSWGLIFDEVEQ